MRPRVKSRPQLFDWSIDWQMLFNVEKCKTVHFGYKNKRNSYYLGSSVIKSYIEEKDLGVIVMFMSLLSLLVSV